MSITFRADGINLVEKRSHFIETLYRFVYQQKKTSQQGFMIMIFDTRWAYIQPPF